MFSWITDLEITSTSVQRLTKCPSYFRSHFVCYFSLCRLLVTDKPWVSGHLFVYINSNGGKVRQYSTAQLNTEYFASQHSPRSGQIAYLSPEPAFTLVYAFVFKVLFFLSPANVNAPTSKFSLDLSHFHTFHFLFVHSSSFISFFLSSSFQILLISSTFLWDFMFSRQLL